MYRSYFWGKATGVNADLKRHKAEEKELEDKISSLESKEVMTKHEEGLLRTYRRFLYLLHLSMVNVVDKIGRRKRNI